MKPYSEFRPTQFDSKGLGLDDRQGWLVMGVCQNRDSDIVTRVNFGCAVKTLESEAKEGFEVHRFGHWGPGWFELILVEPGSPAEKCASEIEASLADYPVLSDDELSERAMVEADEAWRFERCKDRIEYIRHHKSDFEFRSFSDLMGCVKGRYFGGDALSYLEGM